MIYKSTNEVEAEEENQEVPIWAILEAETE